MCGSAWTFREGGGSLLLAPARPPSPGGQLLALNISLYPLHGARLPVDFSTDYLMPLLTNSISLSIGALENLFSRNARRLGTLLVTVGATVSIYALGISCLVEDLRKF